MKLEHVSNHELQRAYKFYRQAPTGQWDDEACLCIEAVLWERGFEFEAVSRCWANHSLGCQATSVKAGETAHLLHNAEAIGATPFAEPDGCANSNPKKKE